MISEIPVAMQSDVWLRRFADTIHPWPNTAEAIRQCGAIHERTRVTPTLGKPFHRLMP